MGSGKYSFMCCPNCRSNNIAHIVYGLRGADPEEMKDIQAGDVTTGGCSNWAAIDSIEIVSPPATWPPVS
jgi:hypothetical protein